MLKGYRTPTTEQLRRLFREYNYSGNSAANVAGLSQGRQVRKYTGGAAPRRVPFYLCWTWVAYGVLEENALAPIERAAIVAHTQDTATPYACYFCLIGREILSDKDKSIVDSACVRSVSI